MVGLVAVTVAAGAAKGVSGYKAGQASSKSAAATAQYNKQISDINAKMEEDRGKIQRTISNRNAEVIADRASYDAYLIDRQAIEQQSQTDFDVQIATRQYDIFTSEKRAKWGNSGVTMQGSPATVAFADAHAAALNLSNIEFRGAQARAGIEQSANMRRYQGKSDYNTALQQGVLQQYASDIQRANIINEGNMNLYAGMSQAYQAKQQANAALVGGISDGIMAGASVYSAGAGGGGSTPDAQSIFDSRQI